MPQFASIHDRVNGDKGSCSGDSGGRRKGGSEHNNHPKEGHATILPTTEAAHRQTLAGSMKRQEGGTTQMPGLPESTKSNLYLLVKNPPLWIGKEV
jgi:hypothetical protein